MKLGLDIAYVENVIKKSGGKNMIEFLLMFLAGFILGILATIGFCLFIYSNKE